MCYANVRFDPNSNSGECSLQTAYRTSDGPKKNQVARASRNNWTGNSHGDTDFQTSTRQLGMFAPALCFNQHKPYWSTIFTLWNSKCFFVKFTVVDAFSLIESSGNQNYFNMSYMIVYQISMIEQARERHFKVKNISELSTALGPFIVWRWKAPPTNGKCFVEMWEMCIRTHI